MYDDFDTRVCVEEMTDYEIWDCFISWGEEEEYERI